MYVSLDEYRDLGRRCAYVHRIGDKPMATAMFARLWRHLDAENLQNHCDARAAFNEAFGAAYRSRWEPAQEPLKTAPTPFAEAYDRTHSEGVKAVRKALRPSKAAPSSRSGVAGDCAAFFRAKVGA